MKFLFNNNQKGYTLLETLVAVSIFLILILTGISSLINASFVGHKGRNLRNILDNFNFVAEEMSRNIRDGYNYRCYDDANFVWDDSEAGDSVLEIPRSRDDSLSWSCDEGRAIIFEHTTGFVGNPTDQWGYRLVETDNGADPCNNYPNVGSANTYVLCKTTNGGQEWIQINPPEIVFTNPNMFAILGAHPSNDNLSPKDYQQPLVIFKILGKIDYKDISTPFSIQTTVSQRYLDQ